MKIKALYSVSFIGRPNRHDIILSELSDFTSEDDAFAIQLSIEEESITLPETLTLITTITPSLGDTYTLTLEKMEKSE